MMFSRRRVCLKCLSYSSHEESTEGEETAKDLSQDPLFPYTRAEGHATLTALQHFVIWIGAHGRHLHCKRMINCLVLGSPFTSLQGYLHHDNHL
jgi:hypothetical protein